MIAAERVLSASRGIRTPSAEATFALPTLVPVAVRPHDAAFSGAPNAFVIAAPNGEPLLDARIAPDALQAARSHWRANVGGVVVLLLAMTLIASIAPLLYVGGTRLRAWPTNRAPWQWSWRSSSGRVHSSGWPRSRAGRNRCFTPKRLEPRCARSSALQSIFCSRWYWSLRWCCWASISLSAFATSFRADMRPRVTNRDWLLFSAAQLVAGMLIALILVGYEVILGNAISATSVDAPTDQFSYDVRANVDQLVTDFGSTGYRVAAARAAERGARSRVSITKLDVEIAVVSAYLDVLRNKELVAVSSNAISLVQAQRERANALFKATIRPEIDVLSADTQLAQAELGRLRDENGVATAMLALREAMGRRDAAPLDVVSVEIKPLDDETHTLDQLAMTSIRHRPEVVAGREDVLAAEANVDVTRTRIAPVVTLQAGGFANGSQASWTPGGGVFAALSLSITLYDGSNRHAIRDARAQVHSARAQFELTQQAITFSVARTALAVKIARDSLQVATTWRAQAERQLALAQTRYQNNVGNFVELNDARAGLVTAQRNEVDARYSLAQSRVALARELGISPSKLAGSQP